MASGKNKQTRVHRKFNMSLTVHQSDIESSANVVLHAAHQPKRQRHNPSIWVQIVNNLIIGLIFFGDLGFFLSYTGYYNS